MVRWSNIVVDYGSDDVRDRAEFPNTAMLDML